MSWRSTPVARGDVRRGVAGDLEGVGVGAGLVEVRRVVMD